jgi:UDP-N-acetylglucosamine 2-epimerase (non-hydrolysing)
MADTLLRHRDKARESQILVRLGLTAATTEPYALVTLHRPSNVDQPETFRGILEALATIAREVPVLFPVHPRTASRMQEFRLEESFEFSSEIHPLQRTSHRIHCIPPLGYLDFLCLMSNARLILTDSGGVQEESTVLGVPCVTLRENTERPVTIESGTNVLAGTKRENIVRLALQSLKAKPRAGSPKFWDGLAGRRIIEVLVREAPVPAD